MGLLVRARLDWKFCKDSTPLVPVLYAAGTPLCGRSMNAAHARTGLWGELNCNSAMVVVSACLPSPPNRWQPLGKVLTGKISYTKLAFAAIGRIGHRSRRPRKKPVWCGHKGLNAAYSWPHWPCCFSMIRATRGGAMMAMGPAIIQVEHHEE